MQLIVHDAHQLVARSLIAIAPGYQQIRYIIWRGGIHRFRVVPGDGAVVKSPGLYPLVTHPVASPKLHVKNQEGAVFKGSQ